jgi:hypothetical protein
LVGTIANIRKCHFTAIPGIRPNAGRPAERWFCGIRKGDTPANNPVSALTVEHVEQWLVSRGLPVPPTKDEELQALRLRVAELEASLKGAEV